MSKYAENLMHEIMYLERAMSTRSQKHRNKLKRYLRRTRNSLAMEVRDVYREGGVIKAVVGYRLVHLDDLDISIRNPNN